MRSIVRYLIWCMVVITVIFGEKDVHAQHPKISIDCKKIMEVSESVRTPGRSFEADLEAFDYDKIDQKKSRLTGFKLLADPGVVYKALIEFLSPPNQKGRVLLFNDRKFWLYIPGTRHPIRISAQQRLIGKVSYGDVTGINFKYDYEPSFLRYDKIEDTEYIVLELKATDKDIQYQKVLYWLETPDYKPYKAEYYTISGKHLKSLFFEDFQPVLGKLRPVKHVIIDELNPDIQGVIIYKNLEYKDLPDTIFRKSYLLRLR